MCKITPELASLVDSTVKEFVSQSRMFTHFDVSRAVQRKLPQFIRHVELKRVVESVCLARPEFGCGEYRRILQDVGAPISAWVYYPNGVDPTGYQPEDSPTLVNAVAVDGDAVDGSTDGFAGSADVVKSISKDRLNIPSYIIRAAGFNAGDVVFVTKENNSVCLLKDRPENTDFDERIVTADGRIRIAAATLGLVGDNFSIDGHVGKIIITVA